VDSSNLTDLDRVYDLIKQAARKFGAVLANAGGVLGLGFFCCSGRRLSGAVLSTLRIPTATTTKFSGPPGHFARNERQAAWFVPHPQHGSFFGVAHPEQSRRLFDLQRWQ
jgi:hypothetical protein